MFKDRFWPILKKVFLPYLFVIITLYLIGAMLVLSVNNLMWVVTGVFAFASVVFFVFVLQALRYMKKINIKRSVLKLQPIQAWQVDSNSSTQLLDIFFLIIASAKLGEIIAKLSSEGVDKIEGITLLFSVIILAAGGILYSFIKVFDKIKLFKGVSLDKPDREISAEQLDKCASIYEFCFALLLLVILPVGLGVALYIMGDSIFAFF